MNLNLSELKSALAVDSDFMGELIEEGCALGTMEDLFEYQEKLDVLERRLPNVTDDEFDEYTVLLNIVVELHRRL